MEYKLPVVKIKITALKCWTLFCQDN